MKKKVLLGFIAAGGAAAAVIYYKNKKKKEEESAEDIEIGDADEEGQNPSGDKIISFKQAESKEDNKLVDEEDVLNEAEEAVSEKLFSYGAKQDASETISLDATETTASETKIEKEISETTSESASEESEDAFETTSETVSEEAEEPEKKEEAESAADTAEKYNPQNDTKNLVTDDALKALDEQISEAEPIFSEDRTLDPEEIADVLDSVDISDILKNSSKAGIKKKKIL